ncbi:MAG: hypothetical protein J6A88_07160 [Oscillospiraceae bacterium]|nr:hypothetical protein [Oscillospiraceae bacterium]
MMGSNCRCDCTRLALIAAVVIGVAAAFRLITVGLTVTPVFLAVAFAVAVVYLGVFVATVSARRAAATACAGPCGWC